MAYTSQQIVEFLLKNPEMTDDQIVKAMETYGISPSQMATAVGLDVGEVVSRVAATVPEGQTITLGDTRIAPQYEVRGSGEDRQVGGIENITVEKTTGDINYKSPVGSEFQNYSPTGEFIGTGKTTASGDLSFFGGLKKAFQDPVVLAALLGGAGAAGLFGGAAGAAGAAGLTAAEAAGLGLTAAEAASLGLSAAEFAAATAGTGLLGGGSLTAGLTAADIAALEAGLPSGLGSLTAGITAADIAAAEAALPSGLGSLTAGITAADIAAAEAGLPKLTAAQLAALSSGGLLSTAGGSLTAGLTPAQIAAGETALTTTAGTSGVSKIITDTLAKAGVSTAVNSLLGSSGGGLKLANLFSGGLGTAGNLLQMQESREAAQRAQARIDAETAAAKTSAAFRPVGMTTRFGTSQFQVDPRTGQLTSAGYTLSPEAKAQQDRFMALSQQGLTQAEQAQGQFAPLQTGAQRLFGLGNQYLAQSPEAVAQNYLNQQMALLQPGRELELANLQNRLQQQGRGGLAVAQGGAYGATTPELQALYNARAQQEAQLAANAQQYGQQHVAFGAGLLGTGAQTMGQYYAGQQAAYAPYTTAMGQVQGLEALGQQPFTLGAQLGQTASTAGARAGQLGLEGARLSTALATSADATRNLGAQSLIAAGNPNAQFGSAIGSAASGLFGSWFGGAPVNALSSTAYGPGMLGYESMLQDIYG